MREDHRERTMAVSKEDLAAARSYLEMMERTERIRRRRSQFLTLIGFLVSGVGTWGFLSFLFDHFRICRQVSKAAEVTPTLLASALGQSVLGGAVMTLFLLMCAAGLALCWYGLAAGKMKNRDSILVRLVRHFVDTAEADESGRPKGEPDQGGMTTAS
jgi:hypothetical protein